MPYWTGVEKCDDYEGKVVLPGTGSDELVDSFVHTTGSDEPVDNVVRTTGSYEPVDSFVCTTLSDEPVDSAVHTTGSDEPVDSVVCTTESDEPVNNVTPCWTGYEEYDDYGGGGNVDLPRIGSDEPVDNVVRTTGSDEPGRPLFSEHGAQLVYHYRVFGDCVSHGSLRGPFMLELSYFTKRACAEARSGTKGGWNPGAGSSSSPGLPV